jgi:choline transport protein
VRRGKDLKLTAQSRHIFACYIILNWVCCAFVSLANALLPRLNIVGLIVIVIGAFTTIVVCAAMSHESPGPSTSKDVWQFWRSDIGYPSGFVFVSGMLNGAFAMGTPDAAVHLAEEIPSPGTNIPKAIAAQYALGFITALTYLIAMLYCITDYDALFTAKLPIAEVYSQATRRSTAGTTILLILLLLPMFLCTLGLYVTSGRTLWTLARVGATPFPQRLGHVNQTLHMPFAATLATTLCVTLLGVIYLVSSTAFNAFVASFILFSSASYIAALLPYLFSRSRPIFETGAFYMRGMLGFLVNSWACAYLMVWFVIYCSPYSLPVDSTNMNYSCLIWGGITVFVAMWWLVGARHKYVRPVRME